MKISKTFTANIYVGFKEMDTGLIHTIDEVHDICKKYVDTIGLCVTITPTKYIYTNGNEPGACIGLINYPRFPDTDENIEIKAIKLAELFLVTFRQFKVTVVMPDRTVMLEQEY